MLVKTVSQQSKASFSSRSRCHALIEVRDDYLVAAVNMAAEYGRTPDRITSTNNAHALQMTED